MLGRVSKVGVNTYSRSTENSRVFFVVSKRCNVGAESTDKLQILSLRDAMSEQKHTQKIAEFISERCNVGGLAEGAALLDRPSKGK